MKYKVWIHVEESDESSDHYCDLGIPLLAGEYDDVELATEHAAYLEGVDFEDCVSRK